MNPRRRDCKRTAGLISQHANSRMQLVRRRRESRGTLFSSARSFLALVRGIGFTCSGQGSGHQVSATSLFAIQLIDASFHELLNRAWASFSLVVLYPNCKNCSTAFQFGRWDHLNFDLMSCLSGIDPQSARERKACPRACVHKFLSQ